MCIPVSWIVSFGFGCLSINGYFANNYGTGISNSPSPERHTYPEYETAVLFLEKKQIRCFSSMEDFVAIFLIFSHNRLLDVRHTCSAGANPVTLILLINPTSLPHPWTIA